MGKNALATLGSHRTSLNLTTGKDVNKLAEAMGVKIEENCDKPSVPTIQEEKISHTSVALEEKNHISTSLPKSSHKHESPIKEEEIPHSQFTGTSYFESTNIMNENKVLPTDEHIPKSNFIGNQCETLNIVK